MADTDLYADLASEKPDERLADASEAKETNIQETSEPKAAEEQVRPDWIEDASIAGAPSSPIGKDYDNLTCSEAIAEAAATLQLPDAEPGGVVRACMKEVKARRELEQRAQDAWRAHVASSVKLADIEAEMTRLKGLLQDAEQSAAPEVVQLRSLQCDAAVAHEFSLLKEENKQLQAELRKQGQALQALQSKPTDPKGRVLAQRLQAVQEENMRLTSQLQAHDELQTQLELRNAEMEELQRASDAQRVYVRQLEVQVEELTSRTAAFQAGGRAPAHGLHDGGAEGRDIRRKRQRRHEGGMMTAGEGTLQYEGVRGTSSWHQDRQWGRAPAHAPPQHRMRDEVATGWGTTPAAGGRYAPGFSTGSAIGQGGHFRRRLG